MTDAERLIKVSKLIRNAAGKLLDDAVGRQSRGEVTRDDVQKVYDTVYQPAIGATTSALIQLSNELAQRLTGQLDAIESASHQLDDALGKVKRLDNSVLMGAWVLSAAAALAGFIAAPGPTSGASLAKAIGELAKAV